MRLFFSIFEKKRDEEEDEEAKNRKERGKALASVAIMLMLLVSVYAEPVAAWPWDHLGEKIKNGVKGFIHDHAKEISGAVGIIVTAACLASTGGAGSAACIGMGVSAAGATYAAIQVAAPSQTSSPSSWTSSENATVEDLTNDNDTLQNVGKIISDANQQAYQKIAELNAMLRSDLTKYDITETGATGDLWAEVYGPEKIYGYSAFPVQVKLYTKESNIPFSYVHIRSIKVYIKEENSTVPLWTRTWDYGTGSEGLNGQSAVYTTILKVPDPFAYDIKNMIETGQISKDTIQKIFNSTTKTWEIFVDISAYREIWQNDPSITDSSNCSDSTHKWDSNTSTCYVFARNADINYHVQTTSAWKHVTRARDLSILNEGFYASLPVKFLASDASTKWTLYQETFTGALSDFIILTYSTPVHVMGSTADYKFFIAPNPGYFQPLSPQFQDDFRFVVVRVNKGGTWETADSIFGNLGTLTDSTAVDKLLNAKYTTDTNALTYSVFGLAYFTITRDDNITIPVWLITQPKVSVEQNTRVVMDDTQIQQLTELVSDKQISKDDSEKIKAQIQSWLNGLDEKIQNAKVLQSKAKSLGYSDAEAYAYKAIKSYEAAKSALQQAQGEDDVQMLLNWLNAAKKYEQAGDFYVNAAQKALYGAPEQAELDAKMATKLSNVADKYEPHWNPWTSLQQLDWKKALILVALTLVGFLAFGRLGAMIGFALGLIVVFGPIVLDWIKHLPDALSKHLGSLKFW